MKNLFLVLALILTVSITFTQAQTDTVKVDKVYMLDGTIYDGKVKTIKSDMIVFVEKETELEYELLKNDIKVVVLANGKPVVFTNTSIKETPVVKETPVSSVVPEPTPPPVTLENEPEYTAPNATSTDLNIEFALSAKLAFGLASWTDIKTDKSKLGFGVNGDLFAGIILDDMFVGIGPHFGYNVWAYSETIGGYTATARTSVSDFGFGLGAAWDGFYMILGFGSGNVSITAEFAGLSETYDVPESIGYKRFEIGWYDGYLIGFALQNYSDDDMQNNLNRIEFFIGWAL